MTFLNEIRQRQFQFEVYIDHRSKITPASAFIFVESRHGLIIIIILLLKVFGCGTVHHQLFIITIVL